MQMIVIFITLSGGIFLFVGIIRNVGPFQHFTWIKFNSFFALDILLLVF